MSILNSIFADSCRETLVRYCTGTSIVPDCDCSVNSLMYVLVQQRNYLFLHVVQKLNDNTCWQI